jgi:hypothetical protein
MLRIFHEYVLHGHVNQNVMNNATEGYILPALFF